MLVLTPSLQRYAWGTRKDIPRLLGFKGDGKPYAEAWWGAHPSAPATTDEGALDAVIAGAAPAALGARVAATHRRLPYLLKLLSIARPLSIQVHPTMAQAHAGFEDEQARGLDLHDPHRHFKDASHKPEMVVALTELKVLVGFRPESALATDLRAVGAPAEGLRIALAEGGYDAYVEHVFSAEVSAAVDALMAGAATSASADAAREAGREYPGDRGVLVALAMNSVTLSPGEALFTGAGIVHSYQRGMGIEIMANSDNVIRAGLTAKPVNVSLLRDLALMEHTTPSLPDGRRVGAATVYRPEVDEFTLTVVDEGHVSTDPGPRIVVSLEGRTTVATGSGTLELERGQAVFVPHADGTASVIARGTAVVASVPVPS